MSNCLIPLNNIFLAIPVFRNLLILLASIGEREFPMRKTHMLALLLIILAMSACGTNPVSAPVENDVVQQHLNEIQAQRTLDAIEAKHQATQDMIHAQHTATGQAENWQATQVAATATQQASVYLQQTQSIQKGTYQ